MSYADDPGWHGPPTCPRAPKGCDACSGEHHWLEHSVSEEGEFDSRKDYLANVDEADREVVAFDALHGTEHRHAHYQCKHCPAWIEAELFWEMEDDADDQADADADQWNEGEGRE